MLEEVVERRYLDTYNVMVESSFAYSSNYYKLEDG